MASYGASRDEWEHFSSNSEILHDLLPTVVNPELPVSPRSKLPGVGKTPSLVSKDGYVYGMSGWSSYETTQTDVNKWQGNPNLGICIQSRYVRAIDVDITDQAFADQIRQTICLHFGFIPNKRYREGSSKFLMVVKCDGNRRKKVVKTAHGIIEFLANGQQFVVAGAHIDKDGISRSRYRWHGGLPTDIHEVDGASLDALITLLNAKYGLSPEVSIEQDSVSRQRKILQAVADDPVAKFLVNEGTWVKSQDRDGKLHIRCPWGDEHTSVSGETSTTYFPAHTGGFSQGHFACLHAHCAERTGEEFRDEIGFVNASEFSDLTLDDVEEPAVTCELVDGEIKEKPKKKRFEFFPASKFREGEVQNWLIKGVLPQAEICQIFGRSTVGKSFVAIDMAASLVLGTPWRGYRVTKTKVAIFVAEGASGYRARIQACALARGLPFEALDDILVTDDVPNLSKKSDAAEICACLKGEGVGVIIIDTLAKTTVGVNENSATEMGIVLDLCRQIAQKMKATVVPLHHEGKVAGNGSRGSSTIKAAMDAEIQVTREVDSEGRGLSDRSIVIHKLKDGNDDVAPLNFKLGEIIVGIDQFGDLITSCVVDHGGA